METVVTNPENGNLEINGKEYEVSDSEDDEYFDGSDDGTFLTVEEAEDESNFQSQNNNKTMTHSTK